MNENREKLLKKIENLLALASNNPNEHEALAAALKAQELMAKYNIELADVESDDKVAEEITTERYTLKANCHYVRKWRYTLARIIANNFRCETYAHGDSTVFYGYKSDAQIATSVFKFLFETGNKFANRHYLKCKKEGQSTTGVLNMYLMGFCEGIKDVLDKQCTALMIVISEEVKASYADYSKNFKKLNASVRVGGGSASFEEGRRDGKDVARARTLEG